MNARLEPIVSEVPKLSVRNLNFFYGGFRALKNISLDIPEKKVTSFIGPSGFAGLPSNSFGSLKLASQTPS